MEHYTMQQFARKWFRIAGISARIKSLEPPPHWRFEVEDVSGYHLLNDFRFHGTPTDDNHQPGTNPRAQGDELIAWIACFGDVTVNEAGRADFTLLEPIHPCPW